MKVVIYLALALPVLFTSCNTETASASLDSNYQDTTVVVEKTDTVYQDDESLSETIEREAEAMEDRLDSLEDRVEASSERVKDRTKEKIKDIRIKREEILSDSTEARVEREWKEFKESVDDALDSLERNI